MLKTPRYVFLLLIGLFVLAYGARVSHKTETAYLTIDTSGDTAQVVKVHLFTARDSFTYIDTINDSVLAWTSPLQVRRITFGTINGVPDTSTDFACTLDCGTNKYGFVYDPSDLDDSTAALLIDNLVDSFNNVAGMSDTVVAQDSVSYIKLVSKFSMDELEGDARWTLVLGDSLAESDSTFTTIDMVCDSMSATINANATVAAVVTGTNSGDSVYTVTSDDVGLAFTIIIGDTAQDTSLTQANVTSRSTYQETLAVANLIVYDMDVAAMQFNAKLDTSDTVYQGVGLSDTAILSLYTSRVHAGNRKYKLITADTADALPCSLYHEITGTALIDTVLWDALYLVYWIGDTASDSHFVATYPLYIDYTLKGK